MLTIRFKTLFKFFRVLIAPSGGTVVTRAYIRKVLTVDIYSHTVNIEKISICLNRGREESVGNDDVSIVCACKYEMVRMT